MVRPAPRYAVDDCTTLVQMAEKAGFHEIADLLASHEARFHEPVHTLRLADL